MGDEPDWDSIFLKDDGDIRRRKSDENLLINDTKEFSLLTDERLKTPSYEDNSKTPQFEEGSNLQMGGDLQPLPASFSGLRYPGIPAAVPAGLQVGKGKRPASPTKLPGRPPGPPPPDAFLYKPVTPTVVAAFKKQKAEMEQVELPPRPPGPPPPFALQPPPISGRLSSPPSASPRERPTSPSFPPSSLSSSPSFPSSSSFSSFQPSFVQAVKSIFLPNKPVFDVSSLAHFPSMPETQSMLPGFSMGPQMYGGLFPTQGMGSDGFPASSSRQISEELSRTSQMLSESLFASSLNEIASERERKATVMALTPPSFSALPALTPLSIPSESSPPLVTVASISQQPSFSERDDSPRSVSPDSPRMSSRGKLSQASSRVHKKQAAVLHRRRLNEKFKALAEACGCGHARRPTILRRAVDTVTALQERIHQLELEAAEHKSAIERMKSGIGTPKSQDTKTSSSTPSSSGRRLKVAQNPEGSSIDMIDDDKDAKFSESDPSDHEPSTSPIEGTFQVKMEGGTPRGGGRGRTSSRGGIGGRSSSGDFFDHSNSAPSSSISVEKSSSSLSISQESSGPHARRRQNYSFSTSSSRSSLSPSGTSSPPSPSISPLMTAYQTPWNPSCIIDLSQLKPGSFGSTASAGGSNHSPSHTPSSSISSISSIIAMAPSSVGVGLGLIIDCNPVFCEFLDCSKRDIVNRLYSEDVLVGNSKELLLHGLTELCEGHHRVAHILTTFLTKRNNRKYGRSSLWLDPLAETREPEVSKEKEDEEDDESVDPGLSVSLRGVLSPPKRLCIWSMQPLSKEKWEATRRAWKSLDTENGRYEVQFDD